jgi:hypothetical protein
MTSDVIREEIDRATRRIEQKVQMLTQRAREARRVAVTWTMVGATAVAVTACLAAAVVWYRRNRSAPRPRQAPLPFDRVRVTRRGPEARPFS